MGMGKRLLTDDMGIPGVAEIGLRKVFRKAGSPFPMFSLEVFDERGMWCRSVGLNGNARFTVSDEQGGTIVGNAIVHGYAGAGSSKDEATVNLRIVSDGQVLADVVLSVGDSVAVDTIECVWVCRDRGNNNRPDLPREMRQKLKSMAWDRVRAPAGGEVVLPF